ncbi:MAG: hypothetical protein L6R35_006559 [Caloplaca aegaea]|nr:MAG: hypothetical protein L6R35_006559 [Caloplaca aegaea]
MCPDGSYCCKDDDLCCSKGNGKFVGPDGNLISNPYTTTASTNFAPTSTDFAPTSTNFAPTSTTFAPTPTTFAPTPTTFTPTPKNTTTVGAQGTPTAVESGSGGLSTIAKGAIGALAGVLLLTVIAAGFFIWRKRREVSSLKPISSAEIQPVGQQYHYQHPDGSFFAPGAEAGYRRAELGSDPIPTPELPSEPSATKRH